MSFQGICFLASALQTPAQPLANISSPPVIWLNGRTIPRLHHLHWPGQGLPKLLFAFTFFELTQYCCQAHCRTAWWLMKYLAEMTGHCVDLHTALSQERGAHCKGQGFVRKLQNFWLTYSCYKWCWGLICWTRKTVTSELNSALHSVWHFI